MKTWIKRISIGLAVALAVVIAGLIVFVLTFDPNTYKDRLQTWVQQRYHRTLTIDGEIEATLFPRLGVTLQGVSLSEPDSTETFAAVDSARMAVAIWPLLSRNVVVDHATFSGVRARLVRDRQGRLNFQDLLGGPAGEKQAPAQPGRETEGRSGAFGIDIAGLNINDGEIQLRDDATGQALTVSQLNAKTGRMRAAEPFDVSLSAHVEGDKPRLNADLSAQGVAMLDPDARRYAVRKLDLKATGLLPRANARNVSLRGDIHYDERARAVEASTLEFVFQGDVEDVQGGTASVDASLAAEHLRVDPQQQTVQAAKAALRAKGTLPKGPFEFAADAPALDISPAAATGSGLAARLRLSGNEGLDIRLALNDLSGNSANLAAADARLSAELKRGERSWMFDLASPLAVDTAKRSATLAALNGQALIAGPGLPAGGLRIPYTGAAGVDMAREAADLKLNAQTEGGKLAVTASAAQLKKKPSLRFTLDADAVDLDKLIPPAQAAAKPAKDAGTPPPAAEKPQAPATQSGNAGADANAGSKAGADKTSHAADAPAKGEGGGAPKAAPGSDADLSALVGPTAHGTIKVGRLTGRGVAVENLSASLQLAQGRLEISPLNAVLYGGKLAGGASLDAAHGNAVATRFTLDGVSIGPLLTAITKRSSLTGVGSVAANLTTRGVHGETMRDNLGGTLQLRLRDGAIKGFDAAGALRDLKQALLGGRQDGPADVPADAGRETVFSRMDADFALAAGVATIKRLDVVSPVLRVSQGEPAVIDLPKGRIDVVANVKIADSPPPYADVKELRGVVVPVRVAGPYDALRYRVDWRAVAGGALSQALQRALGGKSEERQRDDSRQDTIRDLGRISKGITGK